MRPHFSEHLLTHMYFRSGSLARYFNLFKITITVYSEKYNFHSSQEWNGNSDFILKNKEYCFYQ